MLASCRPTLTQLLLLSLTLTLNISPSSSEINSTSRLPDSIQDDYYEYEETVSTHPTRRSNSQRCDYDLCKEQDRPCSDLAAATGCSCPGFGSQFSPPDLPHLRRLERMGSAVVVHWCAPVSVVAHYRISVLETGRETVEVEVSWQKRQVELGNVPVGATVCVQARNDGGISPQESKACTQFKPPSDSGLAMKVGILGGAVGLVLLLTLAGLLYWRYRSRRTSAARISTNRVL